MIDMSDVVAILSVALVLGAAGAVLRSRGLQTDLDLIRDNMDTFRGANQELRQSNDELRSALHEEKVSCQVAIAELRGALATLQSTVVDELVGSIRSAMSDAIHEALTRPDRRG